MKQLLFALSFVLASFCLSGDAWSAGRGRLILRRPPSSPRPAEYRYRYNPYDYYRAVYPKYYGAFHSSFFDNYGVPSGDVGLRGNGIYWTPW